MKNPKTYPTPPNLHVHLPDELLTSFEDLVKEWARKYRQPTIKKSPIVRLLISALFTHPDFRESAETLINKELVKRS